MNTKEAPAVGMSPGNICLSLPSPVFSAPTNLSPGSHWISSSFQRAQAYPDWRPGLCKRLSITYFPGELVKKDPLIAQQPPSRVNL